MEWIATLTPEISARPLDALKLPPTGATVVELRADLLPELDLRSAVAACPLPLLVTLRSSAEGGRGPDDPNIRARVLGDAFEAGAALLDLEAERDRDLVRALGLPAEQIVLSWHDPSGTPQDLDRIAAAMLASPARFVKIVPTAHRLADLERVVALHRRLQPRRASERRLIAFAMGPVGVPSRHLAPLLGPPLAYVAWEEGAAAAPGQLTRDEMQAVSGHLRAAPQRLFGVVGGDVGASLSPRLHAAGYRAQELPYLFLPFSVPDPADLDELFTPGGEGLLDRLGLPAGGWAVTRPYKREAALAATVAAPRVRRAGAANTLLPRATGLLAENTDADGVVGALARRGMTAEGRHAVVQGTGGAARGAAVGLYLAGATVALRGRDDDRTADVADELGVDWLPATTVAGEGSILVNATPLGGGTEPASPFTEDEVRTAGAVVDMVYISGETALARSAREHGRPLVDGRSVLAHQGIAQYAAMTGKAPPVAAMLAALGVDADDAGET